MATSSVSGLASGIQWTDLVDQLYAVDKTRELDPLTTQITANQTKSAAWTSYKVAAQKLSAAAIALRDGTVLDTFSASAASSPSTGKGIVTATTGAGAAAGTYQVEVLALAKAQKLSGGAFASPTTALNLAGDFTVNGRKVSVSATDSLNGIRDKINAVNVSPNASGVTATVLSTANGSSRLVLSSDAPGARGMEMVDSASSGGVLTQLGVVDGTYAASTNANGSATSAGFATATLSVAAMLGIDAPGATTMQVGNLSIAVDLATDSLNTLATKITAAGGSARVATTTENGLTRSRLQVDANVSSTISGGVPDANSLRSLQMLGFVQGGRAAEMQTVASTGLSDAGGTATTSTKLVELKANGASANIQDGDSITVTGKRGDGSSVSFSFAASATSTLDDLLGQLNAAPGAFGGGTRPATASLVGGKIKLTDGTGGDSQLTLSLSVNKSVANGGGTTGVGSFAVESTGRLREVTAGSDASLRVDGVLLSRTSNSVSDVVSGVTLNLQTAEIGTTVAVTVKRDTQTALNAANAFTSAYNELQSFVDTATAPGGPLAYNGSLKSSARAFTGALLTSVTNSTIDRPTLVGISLDKTGVLALDGAAFTAALQSNATGVKSLFGLTGSATGTGLSYVAAGDRTPSGDHAVVITTAATVATVTGSGSTFPFVADATQRHLTVTDAFSGKTESVLLQNGDTADSLATKLNAMFVSKDMKLTASTVGGQLKIESNNFGAGPSFTLAYDDGDTTSAAQLGLTAGKRTGTDVAGTIDGVAGFGSGQTLLGAIGSTGDQLVLQYTGVATGAIGAATVNVGVAAQMARAAGAITRSNDGTVAFNVQTLDEAITALGTRADDTLARLTRKKAALLAQFTAMEQAIARIQAQGTSITAFTNSLKSTTA